MAASNPVEDALADLAPQIRSWVFRYVGNASDLDDLVQEALIEVAGALERFRGESSLVTYARRVVLRSVAAQVRRRRRVNRHMVLVEAEMTDPADDPERRSARRDDARRLYGALDALSEKRRNAVVLCEIEGFTHEEAAAIEDVNVETLRARLKHGRADLRAALGKGRDS